MNLAGIREGDVVQLKDDPSLWLVKRKEAAAGKPGRLHLWIPRGGASCSARAGQITTHWRRAGRRGGNNDG